ncbi:MAG: DUF5518 domain-containing protein [Methanobacterium sp.]
MDWKIIGISAFINVALTITLSIVFFPLLFLGPLIGGFFASYPSKGYENYDKMDEKDGAVVGAISGLIGGLIIGSLFFLGFGNINSIIGLISTIGSLGGNIVIKGYIIIEFSLIMSFVLGLIGGIVGVIVKK